MGTPYNYLIAGVVGDALVLTVRAAAFDSILEWDGPSPTERGLRSSRRARC
jgi:hypothetical protein